VVDSLRQLVLLGWVLWLNSVAAQDVYQVLRDRGQGFAEVIRGRALVFPRDHSAHSDFRVEWWYITANLQDNQGRDWGLQWTLFRQALSAETDTEGWDSNQLWMVHAALTTPEQHRFEQRFARGGIGQAGVSLNSKEKTFSAWLDDWQWRSESEGLFPSQLHFSVGESAIKMQLDSGYRWVLHGDQGYSRKSEHGQASYYYSQPKISIRGTVQVGDETIELSGQAWMDREWSSQVLAENQSGWDWFSLHFDDGNKLMLYRLRHNTGANWISGSWIDSSGQVRHLHNNDIELIPEVMRTINPGPGKSLQLPLEWSVKLPNIGRSWRIKPLYDQQWMGTRIPYWEGVVLVEDDSGKSAGRGYMELTGYD